MKPIDIFLSRLESVRSAGSRHTAKCPNHDDRSPSLSIAEADDGTVLIHCHAGCETYDILASVGLRFTDLYPSKMTNQGIDLSREKLIIGMVSDAKRRGEKIPPLDLNRAELAIHRIKTVEGR